MSYIDPSGLRRRSPNPNSPIPYSPALLSPYIPPSQSAWSGSPRSPQESHEQRRYLTADRTPTIRLVGPYDADASYYAPRPLRTRSDNRDVRGSTIAASSSDLRRHGTDPKMYPSLSRYTSKELPRYQIAQMDRQSSILMDASHRDKPVPPLPLKIRRGESYRSAAPSMRSIPSRTTLSPISSPGSTVVSTLKSLRNPFRQPEGSPGSHYTPALMPSSRSMRSSTSKASLSSSRSSTTTLPVPFLPHSFLRAHSSDSVWASKAAIESARACGPGGKLTVKFPQRRKAANEGWPFFKWLLLFSILLLLGYGFTGLVWALRILLRINEKSDVTMVSDPDIVIFLTLASLLCIFSSMVGLTGVLLNSRPILAFYNLLLWPTLLSLCLVGYTSYKRGSLNLDRKLNQIWSQFLDDEQRLRIQNSLRCCGYFSPMHDATYSKKCYPRTVLPGCKSKWTRFERQALHEFATLAFSIIPLHLICIMTAVLCSNHVNTTFGKGLTPPAYRLRMTDVRANALTVLNTLPTLSRPVSSLSRLPALASRTSRKSDSRVSVSMASPHSSADTLTEKYVPKHRTRTRSRSGWLGEVMEEAGPRGRALREARDRGML